ncbi:MAG: hypothetical protein ACK4G2_04240 [Novosphingobium sp.]
MWLDRNVQLAEQPWGVPAGRAAPATLWATYRRGVLRAKVGVHMLDCREAVIDCPENPPEGTLVWLTFPGLEGRAAVVLHSAAFRARLRFAEPFHPAVIDALATGRIGRIH